MADNQFVVDLGAVKLTDAQRLSINTAIQQAVVGQLAGINTGNKIALLPISKFPKGPILNGIVARDLGAKFNEILNG
jgi:hypothetical protein